MASIGKSPEVTHSGDSETIHSSPAAASGEDTGSSSSSDGGSGSESSSSGCPICAFIEAGACKEQHQVWVACREEAKLQGTDYVDSCHLLFKDFLKCTVANAEYYAPFLEMLGGPEDGEDLDGSNDSVQGEASAQPV